MGKSFTYLLKIYSVFLATIWTLMKVKERQCARQKKDINDFRKWLMKKNKVEMCQFLENNKEVQGL